MTVASAVPRGDRPGEVWQTLLEASPQAPALETADARLDRTALEAAVVAQQQRLASRGVGPRDIVAWLGLNRPELVAALLACERLGAVLMPLNWRLSTAELLACLQHAGVATLVDDPALAGAAEALETAWRHSGGAVKGAARTGDRLLVYTSGTTGEPKGAMHTDAGLLANARAACAVQGIDGGTRTLAVLPMFHVGGLCIQLLPTLLAGGVLRLHPRFDPGAWLADVQAWRPHTSVLVPATIRAVIGHPGWTATDLSSLRFLQTGSSVVPPGLIEAFHARGVPVAQVYGSTETGPFSVALPPGRAVELVGRTGWPAPGVQLRLVDAEGAEVPPGQVGQILVRGDNVMRGYHRAPDHPDFRDGWFHSGDLGCRDAEGCLEVVGRSKDMIISGGENIYPAEIENLVAGLQGVAECAVVGVPDERWGESPVLAVVRHPGAPLDEAAIRAVCAERLARFKHPRRIVWVDELPKTALGKIQKPVLVARLRGG